MIFDVVVVSREGGMGNESARLNVRITDCSCERTWRRVRSRGRAGGSCFSGGSSGWEGACGLVPVGEDGWELCLLLSGEMGEVGVVVGDRVVSRPLGTKLRICSCRSPREDRESTRESASPRRSSTS